MNYDMDGLTQSLDSLESSDYEYAERRGRARPVTRPSGQRLTPTPPTQGHVTRNEFNAAMEKVQRELAATSSGLRTLDGRVNTISTSQERLTREVAERKKEAEVLKRDLRSTRELAAILPLLSAPKSKVLSEGNIPSGLQAGDKILVDSGDSMSALLPMLLLGGLGGDSSGQSSGGLGSGGMDSMMLVLLLALRK